MRSRPALAMCAVTGMVLMGAYETSAHPPRSTLSATPGLVAAPSPSARRAVTSRPRAKVSKAPAPRRTSVTSRPSPSAARQTTAPRHVVAPTHKATPKPAPKPASYVVNGASADTRYGPVQVQITISGHRIVKATAIDYPQGSGQDQQINSYAIPQLDNETIQAQSAQIDTVSGATYTSDGYRRSLQSALDSAHAAGVW